jgi:hypothetical protein
MKHFLVKWVHVDELINLFDESCYS